MTQESLFGVQMLHVSYAVDIFLALDSHIGKITYQWKLLAL